MKLILATLLMVSSCFAMAAGNKKWDVIYSNVGYGFEYAVGGGKWAFGLSYMPVSYYFTGSVIGGQPYGTVAADGTGLSLRWRKNGLGADGLYASLHVLSSNVDVSIYVPSSTSYYRKLGTVGSQYGGYVGYEWFWTNFGIGLGLGAMTNGIGSVTVNKTSGAGAATTTYAVPSPLNTSSSYDISLFWAF